MQKYDNNFFIFVNEIKKYEQMTNEQTITLIKEYRESLNPDLMNEVIMGNIRFILSIAIKFSNRTLSSTDLILAGIKGIDRAILKFDFDRDIKFLTYASFWIEMFMRREVIKYYSLVKISPRYWELSVKVSKLRKSGNSNRQILRKLNLKRRTLYQIRLLKNDVSLNKLISDSPDSPEIGGLILLNNNTPADIYSKKDFNKYLMGQLNTLHLREKNILIKRFGLKENKRLTLKQIGSINNISAERVRQVINISLAKLRKKINSEQFNK